jgi:hypothetical protein
MLYYGLIWLKIGIGMQLLVNISLIEHQRICEKSMRYTENLISCLRTT